MKFKPAQIETTPTAAYPKRWGRINDALRLFPFGRSELYRLISIKAIRSYVYKTPDGTTGKGIRIIDLDSVAELLEKLAKESGE